MVHDFDLGLGQGILFLERPPTILAFKKLVAQTQLQLGMIPQIANFSDRETFSHRPLHSERIGVIESDPLGHHDILQSQSRSHLVFGLDFGPSAYRIGEDFFANGTCVVDIRIDLPGLERLPENLRPTQLGPMFDSSTSIPDQVREDLTKDYRFGKGL